MSRHGGTCPCDGCNPRHEPDPDVLGPDADFVGAGDDVVVIEDGGIVARGVLVDAATDEAIVNVGGSRETFDFADVAHPDSPAAAAAEEPLDKYDALGIDTHADLAEYRMGE